MPKGASRTHHERRYAAPLESLARYVTFGNPGENHVLAFVAGEEYHERFLARDRNKCWKHVSPIAHYPEAPRFQESARTNDHLWLGFNTGGVGVGMTSVVVDVPKEVFGTPPPAWLATWVNWTYALPPRDSCEFRERLLGYALHLQVAQFVCVMLWRVCVYVVLKLLLVTEVSAAPIVHPLTYTSGDVVGEGAAFWPVKKLRTDAAWLLILASPLVVGIIMSVLFLLGKSPEHVTQTTGIWVALWAFASFAFVVREKVGAMLRLRTSPRTMTEQEEQRKRAAAEKERKAAAFLARAIAEAEARDLWYRDPSKAAAIVSTPDAPRAPVTSLNDIPKEQRTFALRFQALKAQVCKPFAAF